MDLEAFESVLDVMGLVNEEDEEGMEAEDMDDISSE